MKLALACTGIGQVQRGFERQFGGIFEAVRSSVDTTLFAGGGRSGDGVVRIPCLRRTGRIHRVLPLHRLIGRQPYQVECLTFALGLHRRLVRGGCDLVHLVDSPLAKVLVRLRDRAGADYRILYMEGADLPLGLQPPADYAQYVARPKFEDAVAAGVDPASAEYVPCGIDFGRFGRSAGREELRRRHGIGADTLVVLDIAAINREFKRVHWLASETARVEGDVLLWIDGSLEDPALLDEMRARLGERLRVTHVPTSEVGDLFAIADVLAHPALDESFGLAIVEALSCGLPVLVHDQRHFRWLVEDDRFLVDMATEGALGARLSGLVRDRAALRTTTPSESTWRRFEWSAVRDGLLAMYERALRAPIGAYARSLEAAASRAAAPA
ncbi:MAG: glycosyltransferase family 4 protein [Planctomycetota bacterium]